MENTTKKITKTDNFNALKAIVAQVEPENAEALIAFLDKEIEAIANKAAKAKEKAAEKRAEGDALRTKIESLLTDEYQTIAAITAAIGDEEVTAAKVTARLTQLVNADLAEKAQVTSGSRKVMGYKVKVVTE